MNIDERLAAITTNLELMASMVKDLLAASDRNAEAIRQDGEHIRALARIAEHKA